jgi:ATP-dependent helicase Lhr and Lhr-like helicase
VPPKTPKKRSRNSRKPLGLFDHRIGRWFVTTYGRPSEIQAAAWPVIANGGHLLMTAPTGSGKTLAAFLWAVNQLLTGVWSGGRPRVLYVSPLKALNTDVQRNLMAPLNDLLPLFADADRRRPDIRVLTRSGDTPQSERRRMLRRPPEILITTPESLNLLLNSRSGQSLLRDLKAVVLDEIHAVAGGKRGTHLITAVERLVPLSGEFQRIALSATVRPLEAVADFVSGYSLRGADDAPVFTKRPVEIIRAGGQKKYNVEIHYPTFEAGPSGKDPIWEPLADALVAKIRRNRSTLIFTNSRQLSEKMAFMVNTAAGRLVAYAHHGSLAHDLRRQVEARLKKGDLKAVFATSSLELGIDIGELDEVVLLQTPPTISSAVQRAGRAGHQVGVASRTGIYCTHPGDLVSAAALGRAIIDQDIEPLVPVVAPLDVLAQVIVGMVALEPIDRRVLYHRIRCASPFHDLSERQFNLVLEMLSGRYAHGRIRELRARISVDLHTGAVHARKGARLALYMSGGTIPDRGYFTLRHHHSGTRIGELDEEFVWEAKIGQVFTLGTQNWQVRKITASDVMVRPARGQRVAPPFWKADAGGRDAHFATRIGEFLEWIDRRLDAPDLGAELERDFHFAPNAAERLIAWLRRQRRHSGCALPHRHHLVVEWIRSGPGGAPGSQLVLHAPWGGRLNWPLALALEAALESDLGQAPEVFASNDLILIVNPPDFEIDRLLALVNAERLLPLLRRRLERSGHFGARFRTAAGRALLLARGGPQRRMPLWMTRLKSQKLMAAVMGFEDFPLLLEAWRSCLKDRADLAALQERLSELASGAIEVSEIATESASPMAQAAAWGQINEYMYRDDSARAGGRSNLQEDLLREAVYTEALRPRVDPELVAAFEAKRQRTAPDYAPGNAIELEAWVRDRLLIPKAEWDDLLTAIHRDHAVDGPAMQAAVVRGLGRLRSASPEKAVSAVDLVACLDRLPALQDAFWPEQEGRMTVQPFPRSAPLPEPQTAYDATMPPALLLSQWLSYYGPVSLDWLQATLGIDAGDLESWIDRLVKEERLVKGVLLSTLNEVQVCDAENYDILLRLGRARRRDAIEALPLEDLPLLMGQFQGLCRVGRSSAETSSWGDGPEAVLGHLERLSGWPAKAALWERELLPARLPDYQPAWLDAALQTGEVIWWGCGPERLTFCYSDELDLLTRTSDGELSAEETAVERAGLAAREARLPAVQNEAAAARYPFASLVGHRPQDDVYRDLWQLVWAGRWVNDGFQAVRQGVANRFQWPAAGPVELMPRRRRLGLGGAHRPRRLQVPGNWYRPLLPPPPDDDLAELESDKERVRLLLARYGILMRPLLDRELGAFAWMRLFRALRLMELAGEVVGGHFIDHAPGPQFISPALQSTLVRGLDREAIFYLNATDPASCCGLGLAGEGLELPARREGTHLVYHGNRLVLVSARQGRSLTFFVEPSDAYILNYLEVFDHILKYRMNGKSGILIESINDQPAPGSPYLAAMRRRFEVSVEPNTATVYHPWTSSA